MSVKSIRFLRFVTPLSAVASSVAQSIAILTNEWIHSVELMINRDYKKFTMDSDLEFLKKFSVCGLWQFCHNDPPKSLMQCFVTDYFSKEEYMPDPNDSTLAIPYAAKRAATFILISSAILLIGELLCFLGHVCSRKQMLTFASGIAFILSGLMILAGMVIFISTFKAEVGNKLRPKSTFQNAMFDYHYGYSFLFAVISLILCEISGTFAIFLFINLHKYNYKKHIDNDQYIDYLSPIPSMAAPEQNMAVFCKRHGTRGRRYSRTHELSREASPCSQIMKTSRQGSLVVPNMPLSDSMRDLTYFNFPPFSRETTCNTVSTAVDINRDVSRDFSQRKDFVIRDYSRDFSPRKEFPFELLRRTTPV